MVKKTKKSCKKRIKKGGNRLSTNKRLNDLFVSGVWRNKRGGKSLTPKQKRALYNMAALYGGSFWSSLLGKLKSLIWGSLKNHYWGKEKEIEYDEEEDPDVIWSAFY